jgi:hypothetical protein
MDTSIIDLKGTVCCPNGCCESSGDKAATASLDKAPNDTSVEPSTPKGGYARGRRPPLDWQCGDTVGEGRPCEDADGRCWLLRSSCFTSNSVCVHCGAIAHYDNESVTELYKISHKDSNTIKYKKNKLKTKKGSRPPSPRWWLEGKIQRKYLSKLDYLNEDISLLNYKPAKVRMKKKDQDGGGGAARRYLLGTGCAPPSCL